MRAAKAEMPTASKTAIAMGRSGAKNTESTIMATDPAVAPAYDAYTPNAGNMATAPNSNDIA